MIVLSREEAGCDQIIANGGLQVLVDLLNKDSNDTATILSVTRVFASLCKNSFKRVRLYYINYSMSSTNNANKDYKRKNSF